MFAAEGEEGEHRDAERRREEGGRKGGDGVVDAAARVAQVRRPTVPRASAHLWALATRASSCSQYSGTVVRVERKAWIVFCGRGGVEYAADEGAVESEHGLFATSVRAIHSCARRGAPRSLVRRARDLRVVISLQPVTSWPAPSTPMPEDSETPTPPSSPLTPRGLLERLFNPGDNEEKRAVPSNRDTKRVRRQAVGVAARSVTKVRRRASRVPEFIQPRRRGGAAAAVHEAAADDARPPPRALGLVDRLDADADDAAAQRRD